MWRLARLAVLLGVLAAHPANAIDALSLDGEASAVGLGRHSVHLPDPEGALTFADALKRLQSREFQPVAKRNFDPGYSITPHWIATTIRNDAAETTRYRALSHLPFAPALSIMLIRDDKRTEMLLDKTLDTPWRADQHLSFAVTSAGFDLASSEEAVLLTRFHPYGVGILPMTIETEETARAQAAKMTLYRAIFYSFAITSILMLVLYVFAIRRSDGFKLILTFASGLLIMAQIDGVPNAWLWPNAPHWNKVASFPMLISLCAAMFLMAADTFTSAGKYRSARLCFGLTIICFGLLCLGLLVEAAWLLLVGLALLVLGLSLLGYSQLSFIHLSGGRVYIAVIVSASIFIGVGVTLIGVISGGGDFGEQNLLTTKIEYAVMTVIFTISYAAQVITLARNETRLVKRELAQAQNEVKISAALLAAEQKYSLAREAAVRQTQRLENVSHDLRQPITALRMSLEPLLSGGAGKGIRQAVDYLDGLVREQLDASPDDDSFPVAADATEHVAVGAIVNASVVMFAEAAQKKGLKLRHRSCGGGLLGSPIHLMRIINNLVSNAIQHTEDGGVLVAARRRGDSIAIEVCDTGPGLNAADITTYTERGQKRSGSDGDGLGLAICFDLARENGFQLTVCSKLQQGTKFSLVVPAKKMP